MKTTKAVGIGIATFSLLLCGCCGLVSATSPDNPKPTNTTTSEAPNVLRTSSPTPSSTPSPSPSRATRSPSAEPTPTEDDWEVIEDEDDDVDFGTVTPGAYCGTRGAKGVSKTGKVYTCKGPGRLRWRR